MNDVKVNKVERIADEQLIMFEVEAPILWWMYINEEYKQILTNFNVFDLAYEPFTLDSIGRESFVNIPYPLDRQREDLKYPIDPDFIQMCFIPYMEYLRTLGDEESFNSFLDYLPISTIGKGKVIINDVSILYKDGSALFDRLRDAFIEKYVTL